MLSRTVECGNKIKRIPYISNPDISYPPGDPDTVADATASTNDNARVLNETHCSLAGFRPATVTISPASAKVRKRGTSDISVSVRINGEPVAAATVELASADAGLLSIPATTTTEATGVAVVTIESIGPSGKTALPARSKGGSDQITVKVV